MAEDATPTQLPREISDAETMRALAHPIRIRLIEVLSLYGPMTATEVGARIGESATTCSFHLRQLAKYGFVEEAGGGRGRARPWKMTSIGMRFSSEQDDSETAVAANALGRILRNRQWDRYQNWLETRSAYPSQWRDAAGASEVAYWLTADELKQFNQELVEYLLPRWRDRLLDPSARPDGALPVEFLIFSYPMNESAGRA